MNPVIIACQTIENELLAAMKAEGVSYPIRWIESGLHNVPKLLNQRLQEELDACREYDTVLLAMSFCGNSLIGLKTHDFQLVIPRSDDCITLLLGSVERRQESQYTYFLTEGWLKGERNIWVEYENCLKRYGEKRGKGFLMLFLPIIGTLRWWIPARMMPRLQKRRPAESVKSWVWSLRKWMGL